MNDPMGDNPQIRKAAPAKAKAKAKPKKVARPPLTPQPMARDIDEDEVRSAAPVRRNAPNPAREPTRETTREAARDGAVIVTGRDGEQLTRRRTSAGDKYHIPLSDVPSGWSYQWNPVTVLNRNVTELVVQGDLQMHENGWRAVPAHRFAGRWTPHGYEGDIVVDGLRLEERPLSLTQEARAEDTGRAKAQMRDRTDALRMTQKALPGSDVARARGQAGEMRMSIDKGLDIPLPQHQLADE